MFWNGPLWSSQLLLILMSWPLPVILGTPAIIPHNPWKCTFCLHDFIHPFVLYIIFFNSIFCLGNEYLSFNVPLKYFSPQEIFPNSSLMCSLCQYHIYILYNCVSIFQTDPIGLFLGRAYIPSTYHSSWHLVDIYSFFFFLKIVVSWTVKMIYQKVWKLDC